MVRVEMSNSEKLERVVVEAQLQTMADALIEIAVRNGPMRYYDIRNDDEHHWSDPEWREPELVEVEWDPCGEMSSHYPPMQRPRHAEDYITAARALGIL